MPNKEVFAKGCDVCGKDRKLRLYATERGVIELCRECRKELVQRGVFLA